MNKIESGANGPLESQIPLGKLGTRAEELIKRFRAGLNPVTSKPDTNVSNEVVTLVRGNSTYVVSDMGEDIPMKGEEGDFKLNQVMVSRIFTDGEDRYLESVGMSAKREESTDNFSSAIILYSKIKTPSIPENDYQTIGEARDNELAILRIESILADFNSSAVPSNP